MPARRGLAGRRGRARSAPAPPRLPCPCQVVLSSIVSLNFGQIRAESIKSLLPQPAVVLDPVGDFLQRLGSQPAGPPLGMPASLDEARALEDLQVLRHRGQTH